MSVRLFRESIRVWETENIYVAHTGGSGAVITCRYNSESAFDGRLRRNEELECVIEAVAESKDGCNTFLVGTLLIYIVVF